jgi:hypothetical protein
MKIQFVNIKEHNMTQKSLLLVVPTDVYKSSMNPVINPYPVYVHTNKS